MAMAARGIRCELRRFQNPAVRSGGDQPLPPAQVTVPKLTKNAKIMLQPRLCTLRSYGSDDSDLVSVMKTKKDGGVVGDEAMSFFATLSDYIDSSKKSQDFEIVSGRLAMTRSLNTRATQHVALELRTNSRQNLKLVKFLSQNHSS
ncbi:hypothetical protein ACLB2K_001805 [Fragaria x ananassa]